MTSGKPSAYFAHNNLAHSGGAYFGRKCIVDRFVRERELTICIYPKGLFAANNEGKIRHGWLNTQIQCGIWQELFCLERRTRLIKLLTRIDTAVKHGKQRGVFAYSISGAHSAERDAGFYAMGRTGYARMVSGTVIPKRL